MDAYRVEVTLVSKVEANDTLEAIAKVCDLLRAADKSSATLLHLEVTDIHGAPIKYKEKT